MNARTLFASFVAALLASSPVMARVDLKLQEKITNQRSQEKAAAAAAAAEKAKKNGDSQLKATVEANEAVTRSIVSTGVAGVPPAPNPLAFQKSNFVRTPSGNLFAILGCDAVGGQAYSLSRVVFGYTGTTPGLTVTPLAPANVSLNGAAVGAGNSPLNNQGIDRFAVLPDGSSAVTRVAPAMPRVAADNRVYGVSVDGSVVLGAVPNDANGAAATNRIAGLAAGVIGSTQTIFAAVPQAAADFYNAGANNRGIAVLRASSTGLVQAANATQIDFTAQSDANPVTGVAFYHGAAAPVLPVFVPGGPAPVGLPVIGLGGAAVAVAPAVGLAPAAAAGVIGGVFSPGATGEVSMYYDANLSRLFVGFRGLQRDAAGNAGGLVGVLVGTVDPATGALGALQPIVNEPTAAMFGDGVVATQNTTTNVVGFYSNGQGAGNADIRFTAQYLKTMKTSSGKYYLILGSRVGAGVGTSGLYCVPLRNPVNADGTAAPAAEIGKIAQAGDDQVLAGVGALPSAAANVVGAVIDPTTRVLGAGINNLNGVSDVTVVGDSVLVSLDAGAVLPAGLYQTTALFNGNGFIAGWTPLVRVGGVTDRVRGAGFESASGNYFTLNGARTSVSASQWGAPSDAGQLLMQNLIQKYFPQSKGGVRGVYSFDEKTPVFNQTAGNGFAMTVILGYNSVMLVETMRGGVPVTSFYDSVVAADVAAAQNAINAPRVAAGLAPIAFPAAPAQANVVVFAGDNLNAIAPLTCCEIARVAAAAPLAFAREGYFYVGGYNGVCRLANGANGWETSTAAAVTGLRGLVGAAGDNTFLSSVGAAFTRLRGGIGEQFPDKCDVRKIVSTSDDVGGNRTVIGVALNDRVVKVNDVANLNFAAGVEVILASVIGATEVYDAVLVRNMGVPGGADSDEGYAVIATDAGVVVTDGGANPALLNLPNGDVPLALSLVSSTKGGVNGNKGVLYVMAGSQSLNKGTVYRYAVNAQADDAATAALFATLGAGGLNTAASLAAEAAGRAALPAIFPAAQAAARAGAAGAGTLAEQAAAIAAINAAKTPVNFVLTGNPAEDGQIDLKLFRRSLATDGLSFLGGRDYALDNNEMLTLETMANPSDYTSLTTLVDPTAALKHFISAPVRETTTGIWMVPGSFGLAVNS